MATPATPTNGGNDIAALDRLTSSYLRGGNGTRTLGSISVLDFLGWANAARPRTMSAGGGQI